VAYVRPAAPVQRLVGGLARGSRASERRGSSTGLPRRAAGVYRFPDVRLYSHRQHVTWPNIQETETYTFMYRHVPFNRSCTVPQYDRLLIISCCRLSASVSALWRSLRVGVGGLKLNLSVIVFLGWHFLFTSSDNCCRTCSSSITHRVTGKNKNGTAEIFVSVIAHGQRSHVAIANWLFCRPTPHFRRFGSAAIPYIVHLRLLLDMYRLLIVLHVLAGTVF